MANEMTCPDHGTDHRPGCDACSADETFEERAAILEYCAGDVYPTRVAAEAAARMMMETK